jgi:hypothetical protein
MRIIRFIEDREVIKAILKHLGLWLVFFLRAHQDAGQSFTGLGRLCGFSHTSVREAIAKARMEEQEEK